MKLRDAMLNLAITAVLVLIIVLVAVVLKRSRQQEVPKAIPISEADVSGLDLGSKPVRPTFLAIPDAVLIETRANEADTLRMKVDETGVETCLPPQEDASGRFATYFCLMQVGALPDPLVPWSGVGVLDHLPDDTQQCRYGPDPALVVPDDVGNADHPYRYVSVDVPLANQNFLIIPVAALCPATTWAHP